MNPSRVMTRPVRSSEAERPWACGVCGRVRLFSLDALHCCPRWRCEACGTLFIRYADADRCCTPPTPPTRDRILFCAGVLLLLATIVQVFRLVLFY